MFGPLGKGLAILDAIVSLSTIEEISSPSHSRNGVLWLAGEMSGISLSYAEQIAVRLRNSGFIKGKRGRRGGYRLVSGAEQRPLVEVVRCLEEADGQLPAEITALLSFLEGVTLEQYLDRLALLSRIPQTP